MSDDGIREHGDDREVGADDAQEHWVDRYILIFVRESTLWPILFVIVGHFVAFTAPVMLIAIREHRVSAIAALGLLAFFSAKIVRFDFGREGRPAALSWLVLSSWLLGGAGAWLADSTGIF